MIQKFALRDDGREDQVGREPAAPVTALKKGDLPLVPSNNGRCAAWCSSRRDRPLHDGRRCSRPDRFNPGPTACMEWNVPTRRARRCRALPDDALPIGEAHHDPHQQAPGTQDRRAVAAVKFGKDAQIPRSDGIACRAPGHTLLKFRSRSDVPRRSGNCCRR
jgi:hypothetical protein